MSLSCWNLGTHWIISVNELDGEVVPGLLQDTVYLGQGGRALR
nr:MAG TPA: hypothetical protein [Caudoviricetes sp.]